MNNAFNYAIERVARRIPAQILQLTFISKIKYRTRIPVTVSSRILEEVIDKQVLPDINIIGGTTAVIPLDKCVVKERTPTYSVYHVPKELTGGLSITSVHELQFGGYYGQYENPLIDYGSQIGVAAMQQVDGVSNLPYTSEGRTSLINDNTILVEGAPNLSNMNAIRVILEYDNALTALQSRALYDFAKLVLLATKAYIYNSNIVEIDQGQVKSGTVLGVYKDVVDSYSDAQDQYDEFLETTWAKVDKLNDTEQRRRLINLAVGRAM